MPATADNTDKTAKAANAAKSDKTVTQKPPNASCLIKICCGDFRGIRLFSFHHLYL